MLGVKARVLQLSNNRSSGVFAPVIVNRMDFHPKDLKSDEHKKRHPLGRVPVLEDGDVTIFESAAEIEEIEVTINTSATSKRFAISRQCKAAIFRLDKT